MKKSNIISIIVPVYFNENNLDNLYENLKETIFSHTEFGYELIFVDDGSKDNSYAKMEELAKKDSNIKLLKLSRNFGSHSAILAGLSIAKGDCVTNISADLQDPPTIILDMYEKWIAGSNVVLAVREDREESVVQKILSNTYYNVMKKVALPNMPKGGFDCFLIDKKVVKILNEMEEKNTTLMGQILWCGFKTDIIKYTRKKREIGKSKWTLSKKIKLFIDSILGFSFFPIRVVSLIGILFSLISGLWLIYIFIFKLLGKIQVEGWTTIILVVLLSSGLMMLTLGIIGEYLWRVFDTVRSRPVYIIEKTKGINNKQNRKEV